MYTRLNTLADELTVLETSIKKTKNTITTFERDISQAKERHDRLLRIH